MNSDFDNLDTRDDKYLYGQCHIFALALHKLSKLPLYALMDYDPEIQAVCLVHVTIKINDAATKAENNFKVLDVSGLQTPEDVVDKYPTWDPGWTRITPMALLKIAEGSKMTDDIAKQIDQAIPRAKEVLEAVQKMGIEIKKPKINKLKQ